ncbi:YihY/virulence factor BrkB family protein [Limibacter armeniacum]|uniref:YihY/virulence factor BrkB family protein n=1 Tax=Limibacter armeniacum TaxID=466084 RepID=UPI002FE5B582
MKKTFNYKDIPYLLKETYKEWDNDDPFGRSAAIAYYTIFSLPGLLIIIVTVAGMVYGEEAVQGALSDQIADMVGGKAAKEVENIIAKSKVEANFTLATFIGIGTLLFGATGLFVQLQKALNHIWGVKVKDSAGYMKLVMDRVTSLGIIIMIGFLLMVSLVLSTAISAFSDLISTYFSESLVIVSHLLNIALSLAIITLLFATIFKVLPDVDVTWKMVWKGALITAILFTLGKFGIGVYLGTSKPDSAFGAAGSIILILLWVSYSCLILFFGAEFTQVYSRTYGRGIQPSSHAERTPAFKLKNGEVDIEY